MVRYDPYTDSFIDDLIKDTTATNNLDAFPKNIIQRNVVEISDESIEKIANAVARKLTEISTTAKGYSKTVTESQTTSTPYKVDTSSICKTESQTNKHKHPCDGCVHNRDEDVMTCMVCDGYGLRVVVNDE